MVTLQFVGTDGLASEFIELKGGGKFSHVDIVLPDGTLLGARNDEVGGQPAGVRIRPADYESWDHVSRISIDTTAAQSYIFYEFARAQIGKPYDETAILGFIFNRSWNDSDAWFCSELAIACIEEANLFSHQVATPANKIDPTCAFTLASTIGNVLVIKTKE